MMKHARTVTVAVFCVLALAAPSAFASNSTAYTCIAARGIQGHDCVPGEPNEGFGHVAIPVSETTQTTLTATSTQIFEAEIGGAEVIFAATEVEAVNAHMHNNEPSAGVMDVTGAGGHLVYKGLMTTTPHCAIANIVTEPLTVTTTSTGTAVLSPESGELFATIVITNSGGICNIAGEYPIEGSAVNATLNGSIVSVDTVEGELSTFGFPVFIRGSMTASAGPTGGEHHAISLT